MNKEELRRKKASKKEKREKRKSVKMKKFEERKRMWEAGNEIREWRNKKHIHRWSKMAIKKPNGEYETVGYICNKCGIRKKSWWFEIKKLFK